MTISVLLVRAVVGAVISAGGSRDELLAAASIDPQSLDDVHARVSGSQFHRLKLAAIELTGDEVLGLHMGEQSIRSELDIVGHMADIAPTLRESIDAVVHYAPIYDDGPDWGLREEGDVALLRFPFWPSSSPGIRFSTELGTTMFLRLIQRFVGPDARLHRAYFCYDAPQNRAEYTRVFRGAERFNHPFAGLEFDRSWLDRTQLYKNVELYEALRAQAERTLARITRNASFASRLKAHLASCPPAQMPSMVEAARHFGISARSLRRRLAAEGCVYTDLVESALANAAKRMLETPDASIHETAHTMGFSVPTAFHRAFKRWTGKTPGEYMSSY